MLPASYKRTEDAFYYLLGEGKGGEGGGGGGVGGERGWAEKLNVQFYFQPPPPTFLFRSAAAAKVYTERLRPPVKLLLFTTTPLS